MRAVLLFALFCGTLAGCKSPAGANELPGGPEHEKARKLYVTKCAKCHKLYDPAQYSDEEWQMWMTKMTKKSKLSQDQKRELSQYIEEMLRKPTGP